jgi:TolB-like protein/Flp pilus assembly protein TadD
MQRRLTTVMAADVVGYSERVGASETATLKQLASLSELIDEQVERGGGRVFARAGDGFMSEFPSPVSAVQTGFEIQRRLRNNVALHGDGLEIRIGIHLADVVVEQGNLLGDGVNIASRIESVAEPGQVLVSRSVFDQVKRVCQLSFEDVGEHRLKNISEPQTLFRVIGEMGNHSFMSGNPDVLTPKPLDSIPSNSIAVLPFANMSADPEQEYFADGFSEDLITDLARFNELFVVSRNTSFAFKDRSLDIRKVGKELGVAYCLEGSVRKMGARVRITAQLIDTRRGDHVWADKFDANITDLFDLQDDLAAAIVSKVASRMETKTRNAAKRKRQVDLQAYDFLLRGLELHRLGGVTQKSAEEALFWFDKAIKADPDYARAYAWKSCATATLAREWTHQNTLDEANALAQRAIDLDSEDSESHRILGSINLYLRDYDKAEFHFNRAVELNPNSAFILGRTGELYNFLGNPEKALTFLRRARKLDPLLPSYCRELEAAAHYVQGNFEKTTQLVSGLPRVSRRAAAYWVAAATHLDDKASLNRARGELLAIDPHFDVASFVSFESYKDQRYQKQLGADLERAQLSL